MTTAVLIAEYLINAASSGTSPTLVVDNTGNGNDAIPNYNISDAAWGTDSGGRLFDVTATVDSSPAGIFLDDIVNNGNIGSSFDGVTELSTIARVNIDNGGGSISRISCITAGTNNGDVGIFINDAEQIIIRWNNGGDMIFPVITGAKTVYLVADTDQVTAADRIRVYYNGNTTPETLVSGSFPAQFTALANINNTDRAVCILNRFAGSRNPDGRCSYVAWFTGQLTTTQISDSHDALVLDNDSSPFSGGGPITTPKTLTYSAIGTASLATTIIFTKTFSYNATGTVTISKLIKKTLGMIAIGTSSLVKKISKTLNYNAIGTATQQEGIVMPQAMSVTATGTVSLVTQFIEGTLNKTRVLTRSIIRVITRVFTR